jgi:hypothetical protein
LPHAKARWETASAEAEQFVAVLETPWRNFRSRPPTARARDYFASRNVAISTGGTSFEK